MSQPHYDSITRLRLLETWLPLAQEENRACQWGYSAALLEGLILAAAPTLRHAQSTLEARATLWYYQRQMPYPPAEEMQ
ncbi:MAG: hypothetical protein HC893_16285 [Chloroflexaceae bacterium]|nr:hypothetical protein [Chloroflexaceae bacterium]NJL35120.1 hypothetical protein [Chloroflexaceae bacterium]